MSKDKALKTLIDKIVERTTPTYDGLKNLSVCKMDGEVEYSKEGYWTYKLKTNEEMIENFNIGRFTPIKIKREHKNVKLPVRGNDRAACWDLYANDIKKIDDGKVEVNLGFSTEISKGYKAVVVPRSNLVKHNWIINNSPCQIDEDYRGLWKIIFTPVPKFIDVPIWDFSNIGEIGKQVGFISRSELGYTDFPYQVGDRVAQMYLEMVEPIRWIEVDSLEESERGSGGFGSTGTK